MFTLFLNGYILFIANLFKKTQLFVEGEIWNLDYFEYVKFDGDFSFSSFLDWKYPLCVNLVKNVIRRNLTPVAFHVENNTFTILHFHIQILTTASNRYFQTYFRKK